jgi:hypothetical protein
LAVTHILFTTNIRLSSHGSFLLCCVAASRLSLINHHSILSTFFAFFSLLGPNFVVVVVFLVRRDPCSLAVLPRFRFRSSLFLFFVFFLLFLQAHNPNAIIFSLSLLL